MAAVELAEGSSEGGSVTRSGRAGAEQNAAVAEKVDTHKDVVPANAGGDDGAEEKVVDTVALKVTNTAASLWQNLTGIDIATDHKNVWEFGIRLKGDRATAETKVTARLLECGFVAEADAEGDDDERVRFAFCSDGDAGRVHVCLIRADPNDAVILACHERWRGNSTNYDDADTDEAEFTKADRLMYLHMILSDECKIEETLPDHVDLIFALHDDSCSAEIMHSVLKLSYLRTYEREMNQIQASYGDNVAWSQAWQSHLVVWLLPLAFIAIIIEIIIVAAPNLSDGARLFFGLTSLIWARVMLRYWERQEHTLRRLWNLDSALEPRRVEPSFPSRAWKRQSPYGEGEELYYPKNVRRLKVCCTLPLIILFILLILIVGFVMSLLDYSLSWYKATPDSRPGVDVGFLTFLVRALPDILFALIVDVVIRQGLVNCTTKRLSKFEVWPTLRERRDSEVTKAAVFLTMVFVYLLYYAFIFVLWGNDVANAIQHLFGINIQIVPTEENAHCKAVNGTLILTRSCLRDFRISQFEAKVSGFFYTVVWINLLVQMLLPLILLSLLGNISDRVARFSRKYAAGKLFGAACAAVNPQSRAR